MLAYKKRTLSLPIILILMSLVFGLTARATFLEKSNEELDGLDYRLKTPKPITEIELVDHENKAFRLNQLEGQWTFLFFGYTHCPDICPSTLRQLVLLDEKLKEHSLDSHPQFLFVSVDPVRDPSNELAAYIRHFSDDFIAATGTEDNIELLEKQLGTFHRLESANASGNYNVTHSAEIFLVDPKARVAAKFLPPMKVSDISLFFTELISSSPLTSEII